MKKILLVGKFTEQFRTINKSLAGQYEVKSCVNKVEMIKGMLKINRPDVFIMLVEQFNEDDEKILYELKNDLEETLVICAGINVKEHRVDEYVNSNNFVFMPVSYTVEELIDKIENPIEVKSEDSKEETQDKEEQNFEEPKEIVARGGKKSILIVDDSGIYLRMIKGMIGDGYDIRTTTSGLNAITLIHEKRPDLILLDYEMPVFDGKQTMKKIRESEETKDIPIVFITAVNTKENITPVLELRPAGYLLKPVSKDRLLSVIKDIIGE